MEVEAERDYAQADAAKKQSETEELIKQANQLKEELENKPPPEIIEKIVIKEVEKEVIVKKTPPAVIKVQTPLPGTPDSQKKDATLVTELPDPVSVCRECVMNSCACYIMLLLIFQLKHD